MGHVYNLNKIGPRVDQGSKVSRGRPRGFLDWAILNLTGLYWAVLGSTGLSWVVLGCTGLHWAVLGETGL